MVDPVDYPQSPPIRDYPPPLLAVRLAEHLGAVGVLGAEMFAELST